VITAIVLGIGSPAHNRLRIGLFLHPFMFALPAPPIENRATLLTRYAQKSRQEVISAIRTAWTLGFRLQFHDCVET
jgi:hypothetical protein